MEPRLEEGIRLFNDGKFFESHVALEEFYHGTAAENKAFIEGLIGLAAAFRLFCDFRESKGTVRMIHQALIRLENYQPAFLGIQVKELCQAAETWAKAAEAAGAAAPADIPKIRTRRFSLWS